MSAQMLAELVTEKDLEMGSLYPPLNTIQACSLKIAAKLMDYAYRNKLASVYPEPEDKEAFIKTQIYKTNYQSAIPPVYCWPKL